MSSQPAHAPPYLAGEHAKTYRPEVDGLRAVAVVAVLIYHAGFVVSGRHVLTGGYLGVDVFFVISGYLITSILARDLEKGRFSIITFYERRARRILPALVFILAVCLPAAWLLLMPEQLKQFGESLAATFLFLSNVYFLQGERYAAEASDFKPLLHTWSLSLEEQFYVLFPILLALCWRFLKKLVVPLMLVTALVSLFLPQFYVSARYPDAAFYLLPTRAWELLAGAMLALVERDRKPAPPARWHGFVTGFGLLAIVVSMFWLDEQTQHPGVATVPTVLGAVSLIHFARGGDLASKLLSSRPFVGIGLISYSLYLWHQPLLAFARIRHVYSLHDWQKAAVLAASVVCAWLTWRFVEAPFRDRARVATPSIWKWSAVATCAMILVGFVLHRERGVPSRIPQNILDARLGGDEPWLLLRQNNWTCYDRKAPESCRFGDPAAKERWVLLGDSHLAALAQPLLQRVQRRGGQMLMLTRGTCPYGPSLEMRINGIADGCTYEEGIQRRDIMLAEPRGIVVLGGRMPMYLSGKGFDNGEGGVEEAPPYRLHVGPAGGGKLATVDVPPNASVEERLLAGARGLLNAGHRVILLYPIPEMGVNVPSAIFHGKPGGRTGLLSVSYQRFVERTRSTYALYDSLGEHELLLRVKPEKLFCNTIVPHRCVAHDGNTIYYADDDHLSVAGSGLLADEMLRAADARWGAPGSKVHQPNDSQNVPSAPVLTDSPRGRDGSSAKAAKL